MSRTKRPFAGLSQEELDEVCGALALRNTPTADRLYFAACEEMDRREVSHHPRAA